MPQPRIQLHYSNRTERLLEALIENLEALRTRPGASLFDVPTLVVPNPNVETYVKFGIAQTTGIAANLDVRQLRRFLGEVVAASAPDVELVAGLRLQGLVLSLLYDERLLSLPELGPVRRYLSQKDGTEDDFERRRFQLSVQVARLFEEYTYSRPTLLAAWPRAAVLASTGLAETEAWQRRLWLALWGKDGLVASRTGEGQRWMMLPGLLEVLRRERLALPPQLHVFGLSYVARTFQDLFAALSMHTELHIYTLNPCREYWEDVQTDRERSRDSPRASGKVARIAAGLLEAEEDPFRFAEERTNAALRLWGRPGRENIRMLNELTECDFVARWGEPGQRAPSLLQRLQGDILDGRPDSDAPAVLHELTGDRSLEILACAGVRREAEVIASEIWRLLENDSSQPPLRFNEIAVILPGADREQYQTHLSAALHETYAIPHNIVDLPLSGESRLVEAASLLLGLPFGRFTRQEMLHVAGHPNVIARFPEADADEWASWCEALGIAHGADHADHAGSYIEHDLYNWDQGARRLALGAFMTGRRSGDDRLFPVGDQAYLPEELAPDQLPSAAGFGTLVRSLIEDARHIRQAKHSLADWVTLLRTLLSTYLVPKNEEDERALMRCLGAVQEVAEAELGEERIAYRVPYELLTQELGSLDSSRGQHLADGVVVSAFLPMRAIPFRVVFVAGLGERQFPAADRRDQLDLRAARRQAGDVSPRERDKYMFLETLLCARERLYLSYVARDPLTGDPLEPSSVVRELEQMLERNYLGKGGAEMLREAHPLRRFDERYFDAGAERSLTAVLSPEARSEAQARTLGRSLRAHLGQGAATLDRAALQSSLAADDWNALAHKLGYTLPSASVKVESTPARLATIETVRLTLATLRRFLECPLQGAARTALGLVEDEEEDLAAREDEPFETARLAMTALLGSTFFSALRQPGAPAFEAIYSRQVALLERSGQSPSALFADAERTRHLAILSKWWRALLEVTGDAPPTLRTYRFGPAELRDPVDELLPPIVLPGVQLPDGRALRVEIVGRTEAELGAPFGSLSLAIQSAASKNGMGKRYLPGFIDAVARAASGQEDTTSRRLMCNMYQSSIDEAKVFSTVLAPIAQRAATEYLERLAAELLGRVHDYLLPCEAVFSSRRNASSVREEVDQLVRADRATFSSDYGPVPRSRIYPAPEESEAQAMIDRRFGLFFSSQIAAAPGAGQD